MKAAELWSCANPFQPSTPLDGILRTLQRPPNQMWRTFLHKHVGQAVRPAPSSDFAYRKCRSYTRLNCQIYLRGSSPADTILCMPKDVLEMQAHQTSELIRQLDVCRGAIKFSMKKIQRLNKGQRLDVIPVLEILDKVRAKSEQIAERAKTRQQTRP